MIYYMITHCDTQSDKDIPDIYVILVIIIYYYILISRNVLYSFFHYQKKKEANVSINCLIS